MRLRSFLGLSAALIVACSGGSTTSRVPESTSPVQSAEPSPRATPDVRVGGTRPVTVHVPQAYDPGRPAPLLILLHGFGSSGREHDAYFHLAEAAAERGYLYVYPDGTPDRHGDRFWDATDACCDFDRIGVDDPAYLASLISEIQGSFAVDAKRVDVIGHSNGGFMAYAMACAHAEAIAAIASLAGATFVDPTDCAPTDPVAVLEIHGTADDTIGFDGGTLDFGQAGSMAAFPGAEDSVAAWATYDGCATVAGTDEHVDVDARLGTADMPAEASVTRWAGCRPGGAAELWTMPGGGHSPDISTSFPAAVLDFFDAHPKP